MPHRTLPSLFSILLAACGAASAGGQQIAIMPLAWHGIDSSEAAIVTDALVNRYLRATSADLMERQQISSILTEQGFEQSGACDASECAVRAGKLLGIRQIVVGSVGRLGSSYVLNLRRVDVSSGRLLASSSQTRKGAIDEVLQGLVDGSVAELSGIRADAPSAVEESTPPARGSDVAAQRAVVKELDLPSVLVDLGPDRDSRYGDKFAFTDSTGRDSGWAQLVSRASDPARGGAAVLATGATDLRPGQELRKLPFSAWSWEFFLGQQFDISGYSLVHWTSSDFNSHSIIDLSVVAWYRPRLVPNLRLGIGGLLNMNSSYMYVTDWDWSQSKSVTTKQTCDDPSVCPDSSGSEIDVIAGAVALARLEFNIGGRLGWFLQSGVSATSPSHWNKVLASRSRLGLTWTWSPSLLLEGGLGYDVEETASSNLKRLGFGVSAIWTPTTILR